MFTNHRKGKSKGENVMKRNAINEHLNKSISSLKYAIDDLSSIMNDKDTHLSFKRRLKTQITKLILIKKELEII